MAFFTMLLSFLAPFKAVIGYVIAGLLAVWGLYAKGKHDAKNEMEGKAVEQAYKDSKTRSEIEDDLNDVTSDTTGSMLSSWTRDSNED